MKTCVATVAVALCFVFVSHHQFCTNARFGVGWIANGRPGVQCGAAHSDGHFQEQSRSSEVMKPLVGKRLTDLFDFGFFLPSKKKRHVRRCGWMCTRHVEKKTSTYQLETLVF